MKNLIQKYFMAIVAVMIVVGFSAFKVVENTIKPKTEPWYSVQAHASDPDLDQIGALTEDEYENGLCFDDVLDKRCSIQITLPDENYDPVGKTIAQFLLDGGMIDNTTYKLLDPQL